MDQEEPHHSGHRKRLRERFRKTKGEGFKDYELLELLLTYAIPRKDVKPIAKRLLDEFGNLSSVLRASIDEVQRIKGIGEVTATFFPLMKLISARYIEEDLQAEESLDGPEEVLEYARTRLGGEKKENFLVIYLDNGNRLLDTEILEEGTVNQLKMYPRKVIKRALEVACSRIIVIHNHPSGVAEPSREDKKLTRILKDGLEPLQIKLIDHLIITESSFYSFSKSKTQ